MIATRLTVSEALAAAHETRSLEIGRGNLRDLPALFARHFPECEAILIADPNTWEAAGKEVQEILKLSNVRSRLPCLIDAPDLYADIRFVEQVEAALQGHGAIPIAVGAGTINDLVKLASHRQGRRYLCVATAASMDGYSAYGASITDQGSKQTFDCPAPLAVLADLDVISAAPAEMSGWGYADLSAKITAGADWILADALGVDPIDPQAWNIVQGGLQTALSDPVAVRRGEAAAMGHLIEGLMLGGFAMQATRSSRPASGAEHQFSHLWDMQHHTHQGHAPSHGAKVGIATLAITALYEEFFKQPIEALDVEACVADWPDLDEWIRRADRRFDLPELKAVALREISAKNVSRDELREQLRRLRETWPDLRAQLQAQLEPLPVLRKRLQDAGAVTEPEQIGITRERLRESYRSAFYVRRRFTILDVAVRTGRLESCLDRIFASGSSTPGTR